MRLRAIMIAAILCLPLFGTAQELGNTPTRGTVFGGYSLAHSNSKNFNGWNGQGTFNFTRNFGVTADFSGNSRQLNGISIPGFSVGTQQHLYNMLFGPTATAYFGRSSVFGHALFGVAHSSMAAGVTVPIVGGFSAPISSGNAFAMAFGGGVDIGITRNFAIRAAQVDYLRTNFNTADALALGFSSGIGGGNQQNSFRFSGGVVWRF